MKLPQTETGLMMDGLCDTIIPPQLLFSKQSIVLESVSFFFSPFQTIPPCSINHSFFLHHTPHHTQFRVDIFRSRLTQRHMPCATPNDSRPLIHVPLLPPPPPQPPFPVSVSVSQEHHRLANKSQSKKRLPSRPRPRTIDLFTTHITSTLSMN